MWYVADLLFENVPAAEPAPAIHETCFVLLEARSALDAVESARAWAAEHRAGSAAMFLGIRALWALGEERPGHGTEIGGHFFDGAKDPADLEIPHPTELSAVRFEGLDRRRPLGELLSPEAIRRFERLQGDDE